MRRKLGLTLVVFLAALAIVFVFANGRGSFLDLQRWRATATATLAPGMQPTASAETADTLTRAVVPAVDPRALAQRLRPSSEPIPEVVNPQPPQYAVGNKVGFWVSNSDTRQTVLVTATLRLVGTHCTMWVQDGLDVDTAGLQKASRQFDETIYPTVHRYFGTEWTPGIDNDARIAILNARFTGAAGYYWSVDEYSRRINRYSNEREILYINIDSVRPGADSYAAVLAHEFQHMVHWHMDSNEEAWVNEGAAELAARLCGYGVSDATQSFAQHPETQLNTWTMSDDEDSLPHYGASYLWMDYFQQRLGTDVLRAAIADTRHGIAGFESVLAAHSGWPSFDSLYADWVVANLLNDTKAEGARYGHLAGSPPVVIRTTHADFPVHESAAVNQYGTHYVTLLPHKDAIRIDFSGQVKVPVVPNTPAQGRYEWWSNRGDAADTTLTHAFDLKGLKKVTLQYDLWYQLEDGFDYAYIEVSTDNGKTWTPLKTDHTTDYDPNGNAFGPGYTGYSGHAPGSTTRLSAEWVQEKVDLTPYAGKQILVRFEIITDDTVNLPGLCLDQITIPELAFRDDAEKPVAGWQAEGFVRMDNELPQKFLVQVIRAGQEPMIEPLAINDQGQGSLILEGFDRATIAISGVTRFTTEAAAYSYSVTPYVPAE